MIEQTKRDFLLAKLAEKSKIVARYKDLKGHGFRKKFGRLLFLKGKYIVRFFSRQLSLENEIQVELFWGRKIKLPLKDGAIQPLYYIGTLQKEETKLIKFIIKHLKKDDIFFDVGANYGFYSLLAEEIIDHGEIHLFEALPEVFAWIERNFPKTGIFLNNLALSDKMGTENFFISANDSTVSTTLSQVANWRNIRHNKCEVPCINLDEYVKKHKKPTFIKFDIEGGELKALKGGEELFEETNPVISLEVWRGEEGEVFSRKPVEYLQNLGYSSFAIDEEGDLKSVKEIDFHALESSSANFIFKKQQVNL